MRRSSEDVIREIDNFLTGRGGAYDWDDFLSFPIHNQRLDGIRMECAELPDKFPSESCRQYCGHEGLRRLEEIMNDLKSCPEGYISLAHDGKGGAEPLMTTGQVIRWWELRRLLYNIVLLVIGVAAIMGMEWLMTKAIPLGDDAVEPMILVLGVFVYGFMANLLYTLGWLIELRGRKSDPISARRRGQRMYRAGLLFSSLLTSVPFWFACVYWIVHRGGAH
jgi:hypothetical protein